MERLGVMVNRSQTIGNVKLLDNTRKIEKLLHNNDTGKVVFNDICRVMSDVLQSNILVISKKGAQRKTLRRALHK